jgi:hypothetical protein
LTSTCETQFLYIKVNRDHQHHDGDNEYSYRNLLWRMDKSCHSVKSHCTVTTCASGLYWNSMLCERLAGRTGIFLK